ncbi:MAG: hypothetical protein COV66_03715 [Nitrospinae bacterium CG11_big_fil_rev_8_21_14_0_20_45_15]|nr:MAG: hypothetical protein COV66_03715 [Nitrospinae bacterium CG11_big_fil_rev_8_21_14_0_20_45_15]
MSFDLKELINDESRFFTLPELAMKINAIVNDPEGTFEDLAEVISSDVGLSVHLLKIVNSGLYNFHEPIETITHAISIVGMSQLRDLALGSIIINKFKGLPEESISMKSFWEHSIATGIASQTLAIYKQEINPERFYMAGLLHEIGRIVLCFKFHTEIEKIIQRCASETKSTHNIEREILGFDHCLVGEALLESWKLPKSQQEVVLYHHAPLESKEYRVEASIVHFGDIFAHILCLGNSGEHYTPPISIHAWNKLGIPIAMIPTILGRVEERYNDLISNYFY